MPVTRHGPASSTVTRSTWPSSPKTCVIPSFLPRSAAMASNELNLNIDTRREMVESLERVDRLRRRLMDVDQPLVGADLEVLTRILVLEGRADHAVHVLLRGQRDRPGDGRAGALCGLHDLLRRRLDGGVVVGLEPDPDLVLRNGCQLVGSFRRGKGGPLTTGPAPVPAVFSGFSYSTISVTTPEPTVRPPSRIAKRRPWSMAIGWISSIVIWTLSPGMTISVPSGRLATPVTSVVRK